MQVRNFTELKAHLRCDSITQDNSVTFNGGLRILKTKSGELKGLCTVGVRV